MTQITQWGENLGTIGTVIVASATSSIREIRSRVLLRNSSWWFPFAVLQCSMMTNASTDPVSAYAAVSNLVNFAGPDSCVDISYTDMIQQLQNVSVSSPAAEGGRQWTYQTCAYVAVSLCCNTVVFGTLGLDVGHHYTVFGYCGNSERKIGTQTTQRRHCFVGLDITGQRMSFKYLYHIFCYVSYQCVTFVFVCMPTLVHALRCMRCVVFSLPSPPSQRHYTAQMSW